MAEESMNVTIRMPVVMHQRLRALAQADGQNVSAYVRFLVARELERLNRD